MSNNFFSSSADEIREYTKQLLSDRKIYSRSEIKNYVEKHSGKSFTSGAYAGALRDLILKEEGYENVRRGYYRYNKKEFSLEAETKCSLADTTKDILEKVILELYDNVGKNNVLNMSDRDLQTVEEIKRIIDYLKAVKEKF